MSPGISRIRMNTSAAAPIKVGITSSTRLVMYWYTCSAVRCFVQPDIRQVLVDVVARTDLPAVHIGTLGDFAVPPDHRKLPRLCIDDASLVLSHQRTLLGEVG